MIPGVGGTITTVAGTGSFGYSGDGGYATSAQVNSATGMAVDGSGNLYFADPADNALRLLKPTNQSILVSAVVDAASERALPVSPGKIVVIYGGGLGPDSLALGGLSSTGAFSTQAGATTVTVNGVPAPMLYSSVIQAAAIVPY